jgi:hypothetical protein
MQHESDSPHAELVDGASSHLAVALHDAIAANLTRYPERAAALRRLDRNVLIRAEDTDVTVTLEFDGAGTVRIRDGEADGAQIRIFGDEEAILALTRMPMRHGLPKLRAEPTRLVLKRQLGGELTIRGLILHARQLRLLLRVLAAG